MPGLEDQTDSQLLMAFAETKDDAAFAELVRRYGSLVLAVCRRALRNEADAEDAAQAAFLALARQAPRWRASRPAAPWLHRVAHNIALNILASRKARERREREVAAMTLHADQPAALSDEAGALLHEELNALPDKYRQALILCHLEGKSLEQVADAMGCPRATIGTWVARGRERLKERLARRGLVLSLALLTSLLSAEAGAAELPATFVAATTKAANLFVATESGAGVGTVGLSSRIASLAEGALKQMYYARMQVAMLVIVLLLSIGAGAGWLVSRATGSEAGNGKAASSVAGKKSVDGEGSAEATKLTSTANTDFALDMYGQLSAAHEDRNLFFSPYSIMSALSMCAEGARGETAAEMGKVLRFPDAVRRKGDQSDSLP